MVEDDRVDYADSTSIIKAASTLGWIAVTHAWTIDWTSCCQTGSKKLVSLSSTTHDQPQVRFQTHWDVLMRTAN